MVAAGWMAKLAWLELVIVGNTMALPSLLVVIGFFDNRQLEVRLKLEFVVAC